MILNIFQCTVHVDMSTVKVSKLHWPVRIIFLTGQSLVN